MPVTKSGVITHTLTSIYFNVDAGVGVAVFQRSIDGVKDSTVEMRVEGEDLGGLLFALPIPDKNRRDDITDAVYELAIQRDVISGEIS